MVAAPEVPRVFDASALIAMLKRERGHEVARSLLYDRSTTRIIHAVNLCEVYYHFLRAADAQRAGHALRRFQQAGLETRSDLDPRFWKAVARVKADIQRVSLGDSFVIALAQEVGGEVVTADHGEFDLVAARGTCPVRFIR